MKASNENLNSKSEPEILSVFVFDTVVISESTFIEKIIEFVSAVAESVKMISFSEFKASLGSMADSLSDPQIDHIRIVMDGMADIMFNIWKRKKVGAEVSSQQKNVAI